MKRAVSTRSLTAIPRERPCCKRLDLRRLLSLESETLVSCSPPSHQAHHFSSSCFRCAVDAYRSAMETQFEYGSRVGIWRLLNLFDKHHIPVTMYAVGMALEQHPEATKAMIDGGHEIASHCWRWFNL